MADLTPSQLGKMSNEQLSKSGYVRVAGFTRNDGSKVKSHIRKLKQGFQIQFIVNANNKFVAAELANKPAMIYNNALHTKVAGFISEVPLKKLKGKSNKEIHSIIAKTAKLTEASVKSALKGKDIARYVRQHEKSLSRRKLQRAASLEGGSGTGGGNKTSSKSSSGGSASTNAGQKYTESGSSSTTPTKTRG